MASSLLWKLASPYDAYVSHVVTLNNAIGRIRYFSDMAEGYAAGLQGSGRVAGSPADASTRVQAIRERLGTAAASMTDEQFEEFISHLGGGSAADVDRDRASATARLTHSQRGMEEYFGIAGRELGLLEARGYNPVRSDVARQLRENRLPATTTAEYRALLHQLGNKVARNSK
ncbi:hypothetical protein AYO38_00805 [bacterium SCGC AG-212-C10]|nr:hypothetical protein AYO38_00805 [bacterium SCGC AG-212-C10]